MKTYTGYRLMQLDLAGEPTTQRCIVTVQDDDGTVSDLPPRG